MQKRLALNSDGELTYCTAPPERVGKGRCNHIAHMEEDENYEDFVIRCETVLKGYNEENNTSISLKNFALENCAIIKEHNQKAYKEVHDIFQHEDACCIVQATATGKSSIMTAIMDEYADQPCVFISPRDEINAQFQGHNELNAVNLNGNLNVITYQKICQSFKNENFEEDFGHLKGVTGLVCIDEIHHLTGNGTKSEASWREAVDAFLTFVEKGNTKVLGATATPTDMSAIQYFCNNRTVSNLNLEEAINKGILNMPTVYSTPSEETISDQNAKIMSLLNKALKQNKITNAFYQEQIGALMSTSGKYYQKARERKISCLSDASKSIIERDSKNGVGTKILVFCDSSESAIKKAEEYQKIFAEMYPDKSVTSSKIISKSRTKSEEAYFSDFQSKKPVPKGQIQILTVLDMYSEGVHAPNLDLAIMERKITSSDSLYYQQAGRVMSSKNPVLVDFTENATGGYVDWEELGKKCNKSDHIHISQTSSYTEELSKIEFDVKSQISPKSYGKTKRGEVVKIDTYLKSKYTWSSQRYLNNVKDRVLSGRNVDEAAAVEPGFSFRRPTIEPFRKK